MPPRRSAAMRELDHLQRNYPPPEGPDFAQAIFAMHPTRTQVQLALQLHGAPLTVGEVGSTAPNAYTRCFPDDSRLVMLNTGLIAFMRAVNRTLFGNTTMHPGPDAPIGPALTPEDAAHQLAALYAAWQAGGLWKEEALDVVPATLPDDADGMSELLTRTAILFILSHELGHAVLHAKLLGVDDPPAELGQAQELEADAFGIGLVMTGWGDSGRKPWRAAAAGIAIALRTLSGLARMGHVFPGDHPPPGLRLERLWAELRRMCGTEEGFYHVTTIAFAEEEAMEGAELLIQGSGAATAQTCDRVVSGLCAMLEECQRGRLSEDGLKNGLAARLGGATDAVLAEAGAVAGRILSPRSPWYAQSADRRAMVGLLQSLLPGLPPALAAAYNSV